MTNFAKDKGDKAEREIAEILSELTPFIVRRKLGAGRTNDAGGDTGDLEGIPDHACQVANWKDTAKAALRKPIDAYEQACNMDVPHSVTFVRFRGNRWRVVLTVEQWAEYLRLIYDRT